jgi:hypothetical protein
MKHLGQAKRSSVRVSKPERISEQVSVAAAQWTCISGVRSSNLDRVTESPD